MGKTVGQSIARGSARDEGAPERKAAKSPPGVARDLQQHLTDALTEGEKYDGPIGASVYDAEAIPEAARSEIEALLSSGDLFRYRADADSAVARFEREFAEFMGSPFALAVNSCSSAMFLALKAIGIAPGDKVLVPAFTFAAVPSSVVHAGGVPVLVEVAENYRIELDDFEARLADGATAVIISHMRGHTSDMDAIMRLCDARDVPVIEDAWAGGSFGCPPIPPGPTAKPRD